MPLFAVGQDGLPRRAGADCERECPVAAAEDRCQVAGPDVLREVVVIEQGIFPPGSW